MSEHFSNYVESQILSLMQYAPGMTHQQVQESATAIAGRYQEMKQLNKQCSSSDLGISLEESLSQESQTSASKRQ